MKGFIIFFFRKSFYFAVVLVLFIATALYLIVKSPQSWNQLDLFGVNLFDIHKNEQSSVEIYSNGVIYKIKMFKMNDREFEDFFEKQIHFVEIQFQDYYSPYAGVVSHNSICADEQRPIKTALGISYYANQHFMPIGCRGEAPVFLSEMSKLKCRDSFYVVKKYVDARKHDFDTSKVRIRCKK